MSFDVDAAGGYGSGSLGDVTNPEGQINSYALVSSFGTHTDGFSDPLTTVKFTNDTKYYSNGIYHDLTDNNSINGVEVMIVNFAQTTSGSQNRLGEYRICKVVGKGAVLEDDGITISEHILRLDQNINSVFVGVNCYKMIITIPHFRNLTLTNGNQIQCPNNVLLETSNEPLYGGYLVFKCSGTFTMNDSCLDLQGHGLNRNVKSICRQLTTQEQNGTLDTDLYAGAENSIAKDHLILNKGDGACWVLARNIITSGSARIGTWDGFGVQYCRGASDSPNRPSNSSNIGGSTICIVCQYWTGFSPEIISKYRKTTFDSADTTWPTGLARAYLAINSRDNSMIPDEGLYALDTPKTLRRPKADCNIGGFGRGSLGSMTFNTTASMTKCFNTYLAISAVADDGYRVYCHGGYDDVDPLITREDGSLVMIHMTQKNAANTYENGRFFLARVVSSSSEGTIINHPCTFNPSNYYVQMIVIPEFQNLTMKGTYSHTLKWEARSNGSAGGIFAIACSGTCDLSTAVIDLERKGTFLNNANKFMDNSNMRSRLPLGQGNGSAFILAKNLTLSGSTRIGGTYSGAEFGGNAMKAYSNNTGTFTSQGGFAGVDGSCTQYPEYAGTAGWGGGAGTNVEDANNGGWFSNAAHSDPDSKYYNGFQGAHIFIAAETISGFNLAAISTGGSAGGPDYGSYANYDRHRGGHGGAGYGGGGFPVVSNTTAFRFGGSGGYRGGGGGTHCVNTNIMYTGGGGAGACFIYCNNVVSQSTTGILTV